MIAVYGRPMTALVKGERSLGCRKKNMYARLHSRAVSTLVSGDGYTTLAKCSGPISKKA